MLQVLTYPPFRTALDAGRQREARAADRFERVQRSRLTLARVPSSGRHDVRRELADLRDQIVASERVRIEDVRRAELRREIASIFDRIDADDCLRALNARALNGADAERAETEYYHLRPGFDREAAHREAQPRATDAREKR